MRAREVLTDPAQARFLFVVTPHRLPILETVEGDSYAPQVWRTGGRCDRQPGGIGCGPRATGSRDAAARQADGLRGIRGEFAGVERWILPRLSGEVVGLEPLRELGRRLTLDSDS